MRSGGNLEKRGGARKLYVMAALEFSRLALPLPTNLQCAVEGRCSTLDGMCNGL
jgi:hypothetical protein